MNSFKRCLISNSILSRLLKEKRSPLNVRFLYSDQFLGIDKFIEARQRTATRLGNMRGSFIERMQNQVNSPMPTMIFTEDLKTVIHSCEDNEQEIQLCIQMMKKFHKQNSELRFGTFVFGPVAMRLFHYLRKHELVASFAKDPELTGFFDQLKSYLLSMDLYFKSGMYQEVLQAFEELRSKQLADTKLPRDPMVLAAGACYKINTPETWKFATDLVTSAREDDVRILRRALIFTVALSLNQNKPDAALEILSSIDRFNNITGNNLKLTALAGLDRLQEAFDILRRVTDQDSPVQTRVRGEICQGSLDALQKSVDRVNDKETSHIYEQLSRSLRESNLVSSQTIDDLVCSTIDVRTPRDGIFSASRTAFPEQHFRNREGENIRDSGFAERRGRLDFPERRRRFAGISDDF